VLGFLSALDFSFVLSASFSNLRLIVANAVGGSRRPVQGQGRKSRFAGPSPKLNSDRDDNGWLSRALKETTDASEAMRAIARIETYSGVARRTCRRPPTRCRHLKSDAVISELVRLRYAQSGEPLIVSDSSVGSLDRRVTLARQSITVEASGLWQSRCALSSADNRGAMYAQSTREESRLRGGGPVPGPAPYSSSSPLRQRQ